MSDKSRKRVTRDELFSKICYEVSQRSTCLRSQVGALVVRDGRIISMGYNGPVSNMPVCISRPGEGELDSSQRLNVYHAIQDDYYCMGPGCTRSVHAEMNAIAFAAKAGVSVDGCTMYCSMAPCINCAKIIVNSGIKEVKYMNEYRDSSGLKLLKKVGIKVERLREESIDDSEL